SIDDLTERSSDSRKRREARKDIRSQKKAWAAIEMQEHHLHTEWNRIDAAYRAERTKAFDLMKENEIETEGDLRNALKDNPELGKTLSNMDNYAKELTKVEGEIEKIKSNYEYMQGNNMQRNNR